MQKVISFYRFTRLDDLPSLRQRLLAKAKELGLMGTILIAPEGINGNLAGSPTSIEGFRTFMDEDPRFAALFYKNTPHSGEVFRRMLVRIKKEIITMGEPDIDPLRDTGDYLPPQELKRWLDEGRDVVLLDTRNDYEVAMGTFKGALDPKIRTFSQFPAWVAAHGDSLAKAAADTPIVTFCTGGIRCEKASAFMRKVGFKNVYQIDGGILNYFATTAETGGESHWQGDCVVFDKRYAVTPRLETSERLICYVCLVALDEGNRAERLYPAGYACRTCDEKMQAHARTRQERGRQRYAENMERRTKYKAARKTDSNHGVDR